MIDNSSIDSFIGKWALWDNYIFENKSEFITDMISLGCITKAMHKNYTTIV